MNFDKWEAAEQVIKAQRGNTLLYGKPGTGKSYAAQQGAMNFRNVTVTPDTPAAELRGHYHPKGGEFVWVDGPMVSCMREGARIILNEIDHAGGDLLSLFLGCLDNPETCRLTLPTGETVRPSAGFHCVATMNGAPDDLLPALRDRFAAVVEIDNPHPKAIDCLPIDLQDAARGSVTATRDEDRIGLRSWLSFASLRSHVGEPVAAQVTFGDNWQAVLDSLKVATAE